LNLVKYGERAEVNVNTREKGDKYIDTIQ